MEISQHAIEKQEIKSVNIYNIFIIQMNFLNHVLVLTILKISIQNSFKEK